MKIIDKVIFCFLEAFLGDGTDLNTVEDFLIALATISVPFLIWVAVFFSLKKYTKLKQDVCNVTAVFAAVGAILIFCLVCLVIDPPR